MPPVRCAQCSITFPDRAARQTHYATSPGHPRCTECNRSFGNSRALTNHLESTEHGFYCDACRRQFVSDAALRSHLQHAGVHRREREAREARDSARMLPAAVFIPSPYDDESDFDDMRTRWGIEDEDEDDDDDDASVYSLLARAQPNDDLNDSLRRALEASRYPRVPWSWTSPENHLQESASRSPPAQQTQLGWSPWSSRIPPTGALNDSVSESDVSFDVHRRYESELETVDSDNSGSRSGSQSPLDSDVFMHSEDSDSDSEYGIGSTSGHGRAHGHDSDPLASTHTRVWSLARFRSATPPPRRSETHPSVTRTNRAEQRAAVAAAAQPPGAWPSSPPSAAPAVAGSANANAPSSPMSATRNRTGTGSRLPAFLSRYLSLTGSGSPRQAGSSSQPAQGVSPGEGEGAETKPLMPGAHLLGPESRWKDGGGKDASGGYTCPICLCAEDDLSSVKCGHVFCTQCVFGFA